ncbi:cupin domain-containing protein (plasmid) [Arthrobacter sp. zg-Y820]|uniref:cupin domain-containing protein n=1 Tax=unclassified Arthrobacter TaxID=235627 RepID=UPI001E40AC77|nr:MULTISPECIES: cupin domain-containing protein [unclassified Arthrobacter]MCC9198503.1 cupin domain-containing protein [Arthrobacter sp. zg-Y820]MDK1281373.1 cupin domain-containing protein [Arthrobacter sp. zg.Y820]WIB11235.1 cupin domain-containing protein [Arthrobacter sp. zg-Y820]
MSVSIDKPEVTSALDESFYARVKDANLVPLWRVPGTDAPEPEPAEVACLWRYDETMSLLDEAAAVQLGGESDRRALNAVNPARMWGTTQSMVAGYQMVLPGETAPAHRHTPAAIRLMLSGVGYTTVDGEAVKMEPGDLVLTPGWTWHDHRNTGHEPMVWLDGLDVPFVRGMNAQFYEELADKQLQPLTVPEDASQRRFGAGMIPSDEPASTQHSPLTKYPYSATLASLERLRTVKGDPEHGVSIDFINPLTGESVLATVACSMSLLPSGRSSQQRRHTSSSVFCVTQGEGYSIINGTRFDWSDKDFFVVPSWAWYEHHATSSEDVTLFSMSDRPMLEPFGLYREEIR